MDEKTKVCGCISFGDLEEFEGIPYDEKLAEETPCLKIAGTNLVFSKGIIGALNEEQRKRYCPSIIEVERPHLRARLERLRELMRKKE